MLRDTTRTSSTPLLALTFGAWVGYCILGYSGNSYRPEEDEHLCKHFLFSLLTKGPLGLSCLVSVLSHEEVQGDPPK